MYNAIKLIEKIRVDAGIGKKKHFNAADRKEKYSHRINLSIGIISLLVSSVLFYSIIQVKFVYGNIMSLALALLIMMLSWVQIYFNWQKESYEHRKIANKYLDLFKACTRILSYINDNLIKEDGIIKEIDYLSKTISEINKDSDTHSANSSDYQLARDGFEIGEEEYTPKELSL
ncbi:MAG: SLATT domain-containing protein [Eubacteriaceae bacterium]|nr:SLATT domain-containing protein [Eubacteriaceae bacterium]